VFEDSPGLLDKLAEFTEMQMEGMDIFISAFSKLKNFPFFAEISNWLVPFYIENEAISILRTSTDGKTDLSPLIEKLEKTYFMCNGDKYSFCLNLAMVPESQKAMMMNMMNNEMASFEEIEENDKMLDDFSVTKNIYTQYFQDLYRFFKLHPWRNELDDIFSFEVDLYENVFVRNLVSEPKTIRNIGELFFDKKFYSNALKVFLSILENEKSNIELFEKVAFCHEKTGNLQKALDYYLKADLIESEKPWILRKLAYCCKYLNKWDDALKYYRTVEKLEPEDLKVQANIGQCLVHLEEYQQALDYYFKIEVLAPENQRIRRPLAWCSFVLGKFDVAADYLQRLLSAEPENPHDLLNLAHVSWCNGNPMEALELYRKSLKIIGGFASFKESFTADRDHLQKHGIYTYEMDLMLDYVRIV
jgi:tetratricopeptide (TPR) repeat protein